MSGRESARKSARSVLGESYLSRRLPEIRLPAAGDRPLLKSRDFVHYYQGDSYQGVRSPGSHPDSLCRIRVYESPQDATVEAVAQALSWPDIPEPRTPVIVCSDEFPYNTTSITSLAECVAAEVGLLLFPDRLPRSRLHEYVSLKVPVFGELLTPFFWIEHYPPDRLPYDDEEIMHVVFFESYVPLGVAGMEGNAESGRLTLGEPHWERVEGSREELESWLGRALA